jgi:hypothetical protein
MVVTTLSSSFFSRPRAWAFFESFQTFGSSSTRLTSSRRRALASKSKIPPELASATAQVGEEVLDCV